MHTLLFVYLHNSLPVNKQWQQHRLETSLCLFRFTPSVRNDSFLDQPIWPMRRVLLDQRIFVLAIADNLSVLDGLPIAVIASKATDTTQQYVALPTRKRGINRMQSTVYHDAVQQCGGASRYQCCVPAKRACVATQNACNAARPSTRLPKAGSSITPSSVKDLRNECTQSITVIITR
jgi:hypothetical protein